jgi:hypothetical protein
VEHAIPSQSDRKCAREKDALGLKKCSEHDTDRKEFSVDVANPHAYILEKIVDKK